MAMQSLLTIDNYSEKGQQNMLLAGWNYLSNMYDEFYARGDSSFPLYLPVSTVMWLSRAQGESPSAKIIGMFVHAVEHGVMTIKNITETFSEEISSQVKVCRRCPKMLADEPAGAESTLLRSV